MAGPLGTFFDLLHAVPLRGVTGPRAAAALRGPETQKAADLMRQLADANRIGVRAGALAALRQAALRSAAADYGPELVRKSNIAALLAQPRNLYRVENRVTGLPVRQQERLFGRAYTPPATIEERIRDIANEDLDHLFEESDWYDPKKFWNDYLLPRLHDEHQRFAQRNPNPADAIPVPLTEDSDVLHSKWLAESLPRFVGADARRTSDFIFPFSLLYRPPTAGTPAAWGAQRYAAEIATRQEAWSALLDRLPAWQEGELPHEAMREVFSNLGLPAEAMTDDWMRAARRKLQPLPDWLNAQRPIDAEWFADLPAYHRLYLQYQDVERERFFDENMDAALENARAQLHNEGEWTDNVNSFQHADTQRLARTASPLYTEQNVFSFAPTGLTLKRGRPNPRHPWEESRFYYRPDVPLSGLQAAAQHYRKAAQLDGSWESNHWADIADELLKLPPAQRRLISHYPEFTPLGLRSNYLGHFRGTMLPPSLRNDNRAPFLLEELQSDPAQTLSKLRSAKDAPAALRDWVPQIGAAALHHAAQQGATELFAPSAQAIGALRGGSKDYAWLYDRALPDDLLTPLAQHYGLQLRPAELLSSEFPQLKAPVYTHGLALPLPPAVRQDILSNGIPYARGGLAR